MARIILITGGARSGKSRYAERRISEFGGTPVYIATAERGDDEMRERIAQHKARRGDAWHTMETPLDLVGALNATDGDGPRLVDCLTLWLSNLILAERDLEVDFPGLLRALKVQESPVVLVTNEVGLGIVPDNALARRFRDQAGRLAQLVGEYADEIVLVTAGHPLVVKKAD